MGTKRQDCKALKSITSMLAREQMTSRMLTMMTPIAYKHVSLVSGGERRDREGAATGFAQGNP